MLIGHAHQGEARRMNHIALHRNYTKNIKGKRYVDSSEHSHEDNSTLGSHGRGSKRVCQKIQVLPQ